nr:putative ribonuclease H-like domain-containing protein [Tanacetum cinerariifolium]
IFVNSTNRVNAASAPVTAVGSNSTNSTNSFNAAGPFDNAVGLNFEIGEKSSFVDPSQYPDDLDMPALEDIIYSDDKEDVGAEAGFSNLETSIIVSPIPTTKVHKDHHVTQIIGDLSSAPQTRSMPRIVKEQGGLNQINDEDFHTCMFACFLSQEEPKRVHQGHTQKEGINYEEVFAPVARIKAIRLFLAYASFMGFMVYQMDVKSVFYGTIEEEVYVCQPSGFEEPDYSDKVYVDDIIFGSTNKELCKAFEKLMKDKFQMNGKSTSTPIDTEKPLLKDPDGEDVDVHIYSDYVEASLDRKSTTGGCQFLGCRLISWQCKKQTVVATSSTKAEYVPTASYCAQDTDEAEPAEVEEVLEVVTASKLMTEVVTTVAPITTATQVPKASALRRRRGVVIQDPEETAETSVIMHSEVKSKDKGNEILIEEPKPLKGQSQIDMYEAFARRLEAELNANINWNDVLEQVKRREKQDNTVMREDLETLWKLVKERFESTEPKNFLDAFLLNTLKIMFEKPTVEGNVWRDQKGEYGLAKMILLVEKKYPLTHFTLQQMLDNVKLEVKEESEMSLELLRLVRRQTNKGYVPE